MSYWSSPWRAASYTAMKHLFQIVTQYPALFLLTFHETLLNSKQVQLVLLQESLKSSDLASQDLIAERQSLIAGIEEASNEALDAKSVAKSLELNVKEVKHQYAALEASLKEVRSYPK